MNMAQITCRDHLSETGNERCQNVLDWLDASFGALEKVASHAATSHGAACNDMPAEKARVCTPNNVLLTPFLHQPLRRMFVCYLYG